MAYEQKDGSGALFKNEDKKSENHPDYKGDITIGGAKFWLAAWVKSGKKGKFMSLAAQPKEEKKGGKSNIGGKDLEDDIPF